MNSVPRIVLKLVWVVPLCVGTLLGPFCLAQWIQENYAVRIPSLVTLTIALGVTLFIYFSLFKVELSQAAQRQREKRTK